VCHTGHRVPQIVFVRLVSFVFYFIFIMSLNNQLHLFLGPVLAGSFLPDHFTVSRFNECLRTAVEYSSLFNFVDYNFDQKRDLISYRYLPCCCSCCRGDYLQCSVFSNRIRMIFGRIVFRVNRHRLMESDFLFDVTLSRWRP